MPASATSERRTDSHPLVTPRQYLTIEPATDPLEPALIETTIARLHAVLTPESGRFSRPTPPTMEVLLVATGDPGPTGTRSLTYLVGCTDPDRLGDIERTLRRCLPASYAITETTTTLADLLGLPVATPPEASERGGSPDGRATDRPASAEPAAAPAGTATGAGPASTETAAGATDADTDTDTDTETDPTSTDGGTARSRAGTAPDGPPLAEYEAAAVEFRGVGTQYDDWQTRLTPLTDFTSEEAGRWPLAPVAATMAQAAVPMAYQVLIRAKPDWTATADDRIHDLRYGTDTLGQKVLEALLARAEDDYTPPDWDALPESVTRRIEAIRAMDATTSFTVNARAVAIGSEPGPTDAPLHDLTSAFRAVGTRAYRIEGRHHPHGSRGGARLFERLSDRAIHTSPTRLRHRVPGTTNASPAIVMDPATVGAVWLLGGASLPSAADRALATTPPERTGVTLPAHDRLQPFLDTAGMPLVRPRTADRAQVAEAITLPPSLQQLHTVILGSTGSGKSALGTTAQVHNHGATGGATIIVDPKGTGLPDEYLRSHFGTYGTLDGVYRFECSELLPAVPLFDIRPQLEAGIPREQAIENVAAHYAEILMAYMGEDTYREASYATDVIHNLVKALFDPVHGTDAFSHRDLVAAARRLHETGTPPPVSDAALRRKLATVTAGDRRFLDALMTGVHHRTDKATRDGRIATLFDHVAPADSDETADSDDASDDATPRFDFAEYLDEDCVIILDTSGYRQESRRLLTIVLLSALWTALKRRVADRSGANDQPDDGHDGVVQPTGTNADAETQPPGTSTTHPSGDTRPMDAMSTAAADETTASRTTRPGGERAPDDSATAHTDSDPAAGTPGDRAATGQEHPPLVTLHIEEAADIASSGVLDDLLAQGRGFGLGVTLSMQFPSQLRGDHDRAYWELINEPGTKVVGNVGVDRDLAESLATSTTPPADVADRLRGLARGEWFVRLQAPYGVTPPQPFVGVSPPLPPGHPEGDATLTGADEEAFRAQRRRVRERTRACGLDVTASDAATAASTAADADRSATVLRGDVPVDSTLPDTERLPGCVTYDSESHALACAECDTRYAPHTRGMRQAIECCDSLAAVDRDDIPICQVDLLLDPSERAATDYTNTQLRFLAAVYMAHQQQFDRSLEYDLLWDSMIRLQEYVGIDRDAVEELVDADLLTVDCTHPHTLYTVTPAGRDVLGIEHRAGVAHGDGKGDLSESSLHVAMVEAGARYFEQDLVADPDSPATTVRRYHAVDEGRLDAAALDADGAVVATLEAERSNNDTLRAVPADFDTMAAQDPDRALWIVKNRTAAHEVLQALNDPAEGDPRVTKTYSENMPPRDFRIDEPGFTEMVTFQRLRDTRLDADGPPFPP